jgi:hypothetical protein
MQGLLMVLFGIGMIGDAYTTFIGIVIALGVNLTNPNDPLGTLGGLSTNSNDIAQFAWAVIGTSVIIGLNAATVDIFDRRDKIIVLIWIPAVIVDLIASWVGSFGLIKSGANPLLSYGLVFIITIFITASPSLLRYFCKKPIY